MTWRLVTFLVREDDPEWDYDDVREQIGNGEAEIYDDQPGPEPAAEVESDHDRLLRETGADLGGAL